MQVLRIEVSGKGYTWFKTILFYAVFDNVVYVLHAFSKKTQKTRQYDLDIAKNALKEIVRGEKIDEKN